MKGLVAIIATQKTYPLSDGLFWKKSVYTTQRVQKNWTLFPILYKYFIDIFQCLIATRKCPDALRSMEKNLNNFVCRFKEKSGEKNFKMVIFVCTLLVVKPDHFLNGASKRFFLRCNQCFKTLH